MAFCVLFVSCSGSDKLWAVSNLSPDFLFLSFYFWFVVFLFMLIHFDCHFDCNYYIFFHPACWFPSPLHLVCFSFICISSFVTVLFSGFTNVVCYFYYSFWLYVDVSFIFIALMAIIFTFIATFCCFPASLFTKSHFPYHVFQCCFLVFLLVLLMQHLPLILFVPLFFFFFFDPHNE